MATKGSKGGKKTPGKPKMGYGGAKKTAAKKSAAKPKMGYGASKKGKASKMGGKPKPPKPRKP